MEPNENLKQLKQDLAAALNDGLSDSEEIMEAIAKIRSSGYDVLIVLKAECFLSKSHPARETKLVITSEDIDFLKSLKISIH